MVLIEWLKVVRLCAAGYLFLDEKRKLGIIKRIKKHITKFDLTNEDLEIVTN